MLLYVRTTGIPFSVWGERHDILWQSSDSQDISTSFMTPSDLQQGPPKLDVGRHCSNDAVRLLADALALQVVNIPVPSFH
jgi:hypothetical protein